MSDVFLSVIIPARSRSREVLGLLKTLEQQSYSFEVEVLVIANPDRYSFESLYPDVRFLNSFPAGVNRARNRGIEESRGTWLYFLDEDCRLPAGNHLQRLCEKLRNLPENTLWGGPYSHSGKSRWSRAYHILQSRWLADGVHPQAGALHLLGGNMAVHRSVFEVERFDESIPFGGAEMDLLYRLWRRGFRGHLDIDLAVQHKHELTGNDLLKKALLQGYFFERLTSQFSDIAPVRKSFIHQHEVQQLKSEMSLYEKAFNAGRSYFRDGETSDVQRLIRRYRRDIFKKWWRHPSSSCTALARFLNAISKEDC